MKSKMLAAVFGLLLSVIPAVSGADASVLLPDTRAAIVVDFTHGAPRVNSSTMYAATIRRANLAAAKQSLVFVTPDYTYKPLLVSSRQHSTITPATGNRWAYTQIRSDEANALGFDGTGIKVAFIDSGIEPGSPGRVLEDKLIASADFVGDVPGPAFHGTFTSGVVAGAVDTESGAGGIARGSSILSARVCANYPVECPGVALDKGLAWAISQHADVINMSLGTQFNGDSGLAAMISWATTHNISVVGAAGNDGCSAESAGGVLQNPWNNNCNNRPDESYPGAFKIPGLIEVGALDRTMARADFSSWGPSLDIMAPGVEVMTAGPVDFEFEQGTSLAAPMVAGVVALIKQATPTLSPQQIQAVLQASAQPVIETKPNVWHACTYDYGAGQWTCDYATPSILPQADFTAAGCIDAVAAIHLAQQVVASSLRTAPTITTLSSGTTESSAQVSWGAVAGATDYSVLVNQKVVATTTAPTTTVTLSGLVSGSSGAVQIRANGGSSSGTLTLPALLQTYDKDFSAMPTVVNRSVRDGNFTLTLSAPQATPLPWSGVVGAAILSDGQGVSCRTSVSSLSSVDCGTYVSSANLTAQFAWVTPEGSIGALSTPFSVGYSNGQTSNQQNLTITDNHDQSATLGFTYPQLSATGYNYQLSPYTSGWVWTASPSVTLTNLNYGQQYSAVVCRAVAVGNTNGSDCVSDRYAVFMPAPLGAPTNLLVTASSTTRIDFSVTLPANTWGYNVYRSDGRSFGGGGSTFSDVDLSGALAGRTFRYRVFPYRYFGGSTFMQYGSPSTWFSATFAGVVAPSPTPTPTPSASSTPTPTPTPSPSQTFQAPAPPPPPPPAMTPPSASPTPTPTPTPTASASVTPTPTPTPTPSVKPTTAAKKPYALPSLPGSIKAGTTFNIATGNTSSSIAKLSMSLTGSKNCVLVANSSGGYVKSYTVKATAYSSTGCDLTARATVASSNKSWVSSSETVHIRIVK